MSTDTKPSSLQDQVQELTGYDETRIESFFPSHFDELHGAMQRRALIFVTKVRGGADAGTAYEQAMSLRVRELAEHFGTHEPDEDEQGAETPAGEDESSSA